MENIEGPLLVIAGAGSGKTRVITTRIAHLISYHGISPYRILAVTFTNKAAKEMKERVEKVLGSFQRELTISTFHAFCARFLRMEIDFLGRDTRFAIFDTQDQDKVLKALLKRLGLSPKEYPSGMLRQRISRRKNGMADAPFLDPELEETIFKAYEQEMLKQNAVDFDDLLLLTNQVLSHNKECRVRYRRRFQHILVDEYQDTNRAQFELITLLCTDEPNLCVVGDEDQSIYSWRGADIRNILDFERKFKNARTIKLEQNYRSSQNILTLANRVIAKNTQRKPKKLWSAEQEGASVSRLSFSQGNQEANKIAMMIKNGNVPYNQVAILFRANYLSRSIEDAFRRKGIPYQLIGGLKFYDRKEIKDILSYARCIVNDSDWVSFSRAINVPHRGIGHVSLEHIRQFFDETGSVRESLELALKNKALKGRAVSGGWFFHGILEKYLSNATEMTPSQWLTQLISDIQYREALRKEDLFAQEKREENIDELIHSIQENEKEGLSSIADFLDLSALTSDQDQMDVHQDKVSLMTVHAAKGLEFHTVFVMGLEEDIFPNKRSMEENEYGLEEERRLFYVAVTRAMKQLFLTHSKSRISYGSYTNSYPSRFFYDDEPEPSESSDRSGSGGKDAPKPQPRRNYKAGEMVVHPIFGKGTILTISPKGFDSRITVRFRDYGTRTFLKSRAPFIEEPG